MTVRAYPGSVGRRRRTWPGQPGHSGRDFAAGLDAICKPDDAESGLALAGTIREYPPSLAATTMTLLPITRWIGAADKHVTRSARDVRGCPPAAGPAGVSGAPVDQHSHEKQS